MAGANRATSEAVEFVRALEEAPYKFNFFQAMRLIEAGRPEDAIDWLDRAQGVDAPDEDAVIDLRLSALEALGKKDDAQVLRWSHFARSLRVDLLRDHLRRLPDFDDFEAEQRAMAVAAAHDDPSRALAFLVDWPNLQAAAELVGARLDALDGGDHGLLNRAAAALARTVAAEFN